MICKYFLPFWELPFHSLDIFLISEFYLSIFFFCCLCFWCHIQKIIAKLKFMKFFPIVVFKSFIALALTFRFLDHAELIFCIWY